MRRASRSLATLRLLGSFAVGAALAFAPAIARAQDEHEKDAEPNPLPKIIDLMKEVETRLNDLDFEEKTQADQKKIVEAMKFQDKSRAALEDLIKAIEEKT